MEIGIAGTNDAATIYSGRFQVPVAYIANHTAFVVCVPITVHPSPTFLSLSLFFTNNVVPTPPPPPALVSRAHVAYGFSRPKCPRPDTLTHTRTHRRGNMNFFRKRRGSAKMHTVPVPAQPVTEHLIDILPETIDQGVHRLVATAETGNAETMLEAVMFLNESLIEGARRSRHRQAAEQALLVPQSPGLGHSLPIAPMPEQWLAALDTLSVAAVPIAFRSLQDLHRGSTRLNWTTTTQMCDVALVNLIFFVLVGYRRLDLASRPPRVASAALPRGAASTPSMMGSTERLGFDVPTTTTTRSQVKANEKTQRQLRTISDNIRVSLSEYFSFLVWNAEDQVRQVIELRLVNITGHPDFHDLPSVASYLSPHDCFIWLLVASVLHGVPPKLHVSASATVPAGTTAGVCAAPGTATSGSASPVPAAAGTSPVEGPGSDTGASSASTAERRQHAAATSADATSTPTAGAGTESLSTPLGWLTQTLLVWNANGDGALFTQHFVEVVLSCLNLYLKAWLQRRTHVFQLIDAWAVRDVVFPSSAVDVDTLVTELTASDLPATEAISTMIQVVTDMVVHASFVFYENTRCLVQLLYLLGPLNTVHFLCVVSAVETVQQSGAATATAGLTRTGSGPAGGRLGGAGVAEVWRSGVSMLMECFAEYVLEPNTSNGSGVLESVVAVPPPEVSALLLQLTVIHIASECCTHAWVEVSRTNTITALNAQASAATRRQQLRTWSTWLLAARSTLFRQGTHGAVAQWAKPMAPQEQERLDAIFVQMLCLAFEDLYAFAMVIHRRDAGALLNLRSRRVLFTVFSRIKTFVTRLHDEHSAEEVKEGSRVLPTLSESSFNAVNEVLDKFVSALRVNPAAPSTNHRSYWLLAVSYLRLSGLQGAGDDPLSISLNYSCSTPGGSVRYLRDRSYECYEDWVIQHQGKSWVQDEHGCNLERYSHEFQPSDFVAHDRLLYCSMRFLCVAVRAAREEERQAGTSAPSRFIASGDSQSEVYLSAFTRFLLMMDTLSCSSLCAFLRAAHRMLVVREESGGGAPDASHSRSVANPLEAEPRSALIDSVAVHQANLFAINTSLFFL